MDALPRLGQRNHGRPFGSNGVSNGWNLSEKSVDPAAATPTEAPYVPQAFASRPVSHQAMRSRGAPMPHLRGKVTAERQQQQQLITVADAWNHSHAPAADEPHANGQSLMAPDLHAANLASAYANGARPSTTPGVVAGNRPRHVPQLRPAGAPYASSAGPAGCAPPAPALAARPSTTSCGTRGASNGADPYPVLEPLEDETAENRLSREVAELQKALHHTQAALVSKYRGRGNRFVGGAQFRTAEQARNPANNGRVGTPAQSERPVPTSSKSEAAISKCDQCIALKATLKKRKEEEELWKGEEQLLRQRLQESEQQVLSARLDVSALRTSLNASEAENAALRAAAADACKPSSPPPPPAPASPRSGVDAAMMETLRQQISQLQQDKAEALSAASDAEQRYHTSEEWGRSQAAALQASEAAAEERESALHQQVRSLAEELKEAHRRLATREELAMSLEEMEARALRAEGEVDDLRQQLAAARQALAEAQAACALEAERANTEADRANDLAERVRELERQLAEALAALHAAAGPSEAEARVNDLEEEVMALREALREEQHSAAQAALAAGEALTRSEADVNTLSDRVAELEAELAGLADACTPPQLEAMRRTLTNALDDTEAELGLAMRDAESQRQALEQTEGELAKVRAEKEAQAAGEAERLKMRSATADEAAAVAALLRAEVAKLKQLLAEANAKLNAAAQGSSAEADRLRREIDELAAEVKRLEDLREREKAEVRRAKDEEMRSLKEQLKEADAKTAEKEADTQKLNRALDAARKEAEQWKKDQEATQEKLTSTLKEQFDEGAQSSVRLCVVAPTVNVTFGEQTLSYKAPLPKERIRNTLELQVLPNFAKSFIQQRENVSPDGGTIDEWLKEVTGTMQGSIEKHLSRVFREGQ